MAVVVGWLVLALASLILIGFVWNLTEEKADQGRFPAPGTLVEGVHLDCQGVEKPAVILQSGIAASSVGWALVLPELASFCFTCAVDRPGFGWSDMSRSPRTPDQFVAELDAVVQFAGGSAILVGHSFGGLLVRLYAARHPDRVLGLVLVDPALLSEWASPIPAALARLKTGANLARRGAFLAQIGLVRFSLWLLTTRARGVSRGLAKVTSSRGAPVLDRLVGEIRKLPPELWPVVKAHWCRSSSFRAMADHLEALPAVAAAVAQCALPSDLPLTVISGSQLTASEMREHEQIARSSARGIHVVAERSGHWVHLDRPDLIIEAVRSMRATVSR